MIYQSLIVVKKEFDRGPQFAEGKEKAPTGGSISARKNQFVCSNFVGRIFEF
jgi:hypothetical protein